METSHEDLHPFLDASLAQLAKRSSEQNARTKVVEKNETHTCNTGVLFFHKS
jgi:hypothetical protein